MKEGVCELVTKPAFKQTAESLRDSADNAMKGKAYRGLIELITNSIDSYNAVNSSERDILIHFTSKDKTVRVYDRAEGMSSSQFNKNIIVRGSIKHDDAMDEISQPATHGFGSQINVMSEIGKPRRGRFGLGLKDLPSLGSTTYESIKDGEYSLLRILDTFTGDPDIHEFIEDSSTATPIVRCWKATTKEYENLRLGKTNGSGTLITINLRSLPTQHTLMDQLTYHFELHEILQHEKTTIRVKYDDKKPQKLRYVPPKPTGNPKYEEEISIIGFEKIYPDGNEPTAKVTLYETDEDLTDKTIPTGNEFKQYGFWVTDGAEAVYDRTFFKYDTGALSILGHSFFGKIEVPYINDLFWQNKEGTFTSNNPKGILSSSRHGLDRDHPFMVALGKQINPILTKLLDVKRNDDIGMSDNFQSRDAAMNRALLKVFNEIARENEQDEEEGGIGDIEKSLSIIPRMAYLEVDGDAKVFTVKISSDEYLPDSKLSVEFTGEKKENGDWRSIDIVKQSDFAHSQKDFYTAQIHIKAKEEFAEEFLEISVGNLTDVATLSTDEGEYVDDMIEEFMFENANVSARPNTDKKIKLYIPTDLYNSHIDGGEPKVYPRQSDLFSLDKEANIIFNESVLAYQKTIVLRGKQLGSSDEITATFGDKKATCKVKITNNQSRGGGARTAFSADIHNKYWRALVGKDDKGDGLVCTVYTEHDRAKEVLGPDPKNGQDTVQARTFLTEVIASAWADYALLTINKVGDDGDKQTLIADRMEYINKFLDITSKFLSGNKIE